LELESQHFKIFTFSRQIHKMFRGTRTPASPRKKKRWAYPYVETMAAIDLQSVCR
jgi:hypothetical protein